MGAIDCAPAIFLVNGCVLRIAGPEVVVLRCITQGMGGGGGGAVGNSKLVGAASITDVTTLTATPRKLSTSLAFSGDEMDAALLAGEADLYDEEPPSEKSQRSAANGFHFGGVYRASPAGTGVLIAVPIVTVAVARVRAAWCSGVLLSHNGNQLRCRSENL